jgi:hypothetical protein
MSRSIATAFRRSRTAQSGSSAARVFREDFARPSAGRGPARPKGLPRILQAGAAQKAGRESLRTCAIATAPLLDFDPGLLEIEPELPIFFDRSPRSGENPRRSPCEASPTAVDLWRAGKNNNLRIVNLRKFHEALSLKCIVGVVAVVLLFAASASPETLTSSGPIVIDGANGTVISRMRITSTSGSCVTISNSTNITIEKSEIGPCGEADAKTPGNGISISGGDGIRIYDDYIHVDNLASDCCDTRDNVLVQGSSNVTIQGNVIAYGETNVEIDGAPSDHISVIGNFLLNPRGPFPRGQNFQSWGAASLGPNRSIVVADNYALSSQNSEVYRYREHQEDSINFGYTTGAVAKGNYVSGGHSPSGCGIIADDHANGMQFLDNILSDTGQCGIGIANGTSQTVTGNKILNLTPIAGAGNTALYVWNLYKTAPCGPVLLSANIGDEVKIDGVSRSGFWNGGGCGTVTLTNNVWNQAAHEQLYPMSATNPPPSIPVRPKNCVAVSPYTTNKSLPSCDPPSATSSTSPSP